LRKNEVLFGKKFLAISSKCFIFGLVRFLHESGVRTIQKGFNPVLIQGFLQFAQPLKYVIKSPVIKFFSHEEYTLLEGF
jgi:hypothetical protein